MWPPSFPTRFAELLESLSTGHVRLTLFSIRRHPRSMEQPRFTVFFFPLISIASFDNVLFFRSYGARTSVRRERVGLVMQANLFKHLFYSLPAVVNTQRGKTQRVVMQKRRGSMFLVLFFLRTEHGQAFFFSLLPKRDKRHKSLFGKCSSNALRKKKRTSTKKTYLKNASTEGTCRPVAL